ncbi:hypothetical protein DFJ58DRAFT_732088 [Suillus subalutaceus]|uniref:uncharacterized protein n=1 Tax=Suillus subalutaceus TaxID=48586 RepID=UPI001B868705|nr:uncharacterized protein DFJ58DRAFT_732088 [Suillus subalutaceus]KAG1842412.1 hypothetical protein DFJ58DRAFT_732088 [Suillus subalutaceus]
MDAAKPCIKGWKCHSSTWFTASHILGWHFSGLEDAPNFGSKLTIMITICIYSSGPSISTLPWAKIAYVASPVETLEPASLSPCSDYPGEMALDVTATATASSGYDIAQGQPSSPSPSPIIPRHNFRQRIRSHWGVDMNHHMKHRNIDSALKAEIGSLLVRDLPWCDNCLIDIADVFISPAQRDTMIHRWTRPGGALVENKGAYEWTAISKAPLPLQHSNWLELVGTPVDKTYERLLSNFFNEVTILSRRHKNHFKKGAAIPVDVGLRLWTAHSRTLLEVSRSPDIILTASNSEAKWCNLISVIEVKWKDSPDLLMSAILQLGDKATFVFHHQPHRQWFPCLS